MKIKSIPFIHFASLILITAALVACGDEMTNKKKKGGDGEKASDFFANVIYGDDDRLDIYQVQDAALLSLADSTVALIEGVNLREEGATTHIATSRFATSFRPALCETERFREQDTAAFCSGFLVAPNIIVTAGHCVQTQGAASSDCATTRFVFGFNVPAANARVTSVPTTEVYKCKRIIKQQVVGSGADYSVVELDRDVLNHKPLKFRRSGTAAVGDSLVVIGHPSGLPTKISGGATVRKIYPAYLQTNLDTYGGNSGSAVFNTTTLEVEGILVRGEEDFIQQGGCTTSKRCELERCRGEDVTKATEFQSYVP